LAEKYSDILGKVAANNICIDIHLEKSDIQGYL